MSRILSYIFLSILLILALSGCEQPKTALSLATYTYSTNDRIENLKPVAKELESILDRPIEITSYPDVASFLEGIQSNKVDIGLINTLGYLLLSLDNQYMSPVATLKVRENALDNYKTALLSRKDAVKDLDDLKSKAKNLSMLFVAEGSTSGNLVPRLMLSSIDIRSPKDQFKDVQYGGNHTSTFNKLLSGEVDLCAIGSNEYFKQIQKDSSLLDSVNLLWLSEEIPLGPLLLNNDIAQEEKEKILHLFLNLHQTNSAALESIKGGWSEAKQADFFHPITDSYYDDFRRVNGNETDLANILKLFDK